jgi:hypothetical protein
MEPDLIERRTQALQFRHNAFMHTRARRKKKRTSERWLFNQAFRPGRLSRANSRMRANAEAVAVNQLLLTAQDAIKVSLPFSCRFVPKGEPMPAH